MKKITQIYALEFKNLYIIKNNPFYIDLQTKNYHSSNKRITENILITDIDQTKN